MSTWLLLAATVLSYVSLFLVIRKGHNSERRSRHEAERAIQSFERMREETDRVSPGGSEKRNGAVHTGV